MISLSINFFERKEIITTKMPPYNNVLGRKNHTGVTTSKQRNPAYTCATNKQTTNKLIRLFERVKNKLLAMNKIRTAVLTEICFHVIM